MEDEDREDMEELEVMRRAYEVLGKTLPPEPEPPAPGRGRLYFTFGTGYARNPHPAGDWIHPDGYLTVDYPLDREDVADFGATLAMKRDARERARMAIWSWLEGHYAFEYDQVPNPRWCPRGELFRVVLP